ncbi:MAG: site-specific DNA-methyltransferase [Polyangiaceae bacterium]|nr:site-specific DNA-methyltransferase [Polyangiaceae bacterium]
MWDIPIAAPVARERTGYPTQKPEAPVERLIRARSVPGDLVLDPYIGSGAAVAVAAGFGRRVIGVDESEEALGVTRGRLRRAAVPSSEYVLQRQNDPTPR